MFAGCYLLIPALFAVSRSLFTVCCLLDVCWLLFCACCLLFVGRRSLSLFVVRCVMSVVGGAVICRSLHAV